MTENPQHRLWILYIFITVMDTGENDRVPTQYILKTADTIEMLTTAAAEYAIQLEASTEPDTQLWLVAHELGCRALAGKIYASDTAVIALQGGEVLFYNAARLLDRNRSAA